MAENFLNFAKDINLQIQEANFTPSRIKQKKPTPKQHDQTSKNQRERILEALRKK